MTRLSVILGLALATTPALADRAPPPPVIARILVTQIESSATLVKVDAGSDRGVDKGDRCAFYDDQGKKLVATCAIVRVDKRMTTLKTDLPAARLEKVTVKLGVYLPT